MTDISSKLKLDAVLQKSLSGIRLEDEDLLFLLKEREISEISKIKEAADILNQTVNSKNVSYVVNRNINFTNICGKAESGIQDGFSHIPF